MPICPGCERSIPYERLDLHQRYCEELDAGEIDWARTVEYLDERVAQLEARLDQRRQTIETEAERQLSESERASRKIGKPDQGV